MSSFDEWFTTPPDFFDKPVCSCAECNGDIYEGYDAYKVDGEIYCDQCISKMRFTAERI